MQIVVFNCGSSSLNYKVFSTENDSLSVIGFGKAHRVGVSGSEPAFLEHHLQGQYLRLVTPIPTHREAARLILSFLREQRIGFDYIGHRFVHGGSIFQRSTWLTAENEADLRACLPLASIHNPNSMSVIEECHAEHPDLPQYLTFDTAFHASMPEESYRYLLPQETINQFGFRKYGFHGLSYQYVTRRAAEFLERNPTELKIIACHLGTGGSSAAAILHGKSLDTTMGFTPLAGLMMSTRTGDLDPWLVLRLMEDLQLSPDGLDVLLNKKSGLLGISGFSSDLRDILQAMEEKQDERAGLAFDMYVTRLRKTIGALATEMGGVDVLIFTDDIGAQNDRVRSAACQGLEWCGIVLDESLNRKADPQQINLINTGASPAKILCMPTDEERVIAEEGWALVEGRDV